MTIEELRQCSKWVGKKPLEILKHVREAGGWSRVFPRRSELVFEAIHKWVPVPIPAVRDTSVFPEWASRIRNYFNETPTSLKLLSEAGGRLKLLEIKDRLPGFTVLRLPVGPIPIPNGAHTFALSGLVCLDEYNEPWFEMNKVGAVYHYAGDVTVGKKVDAALRAYRNMPVFKFIKPDDTGGSQELIVQNRKRQNFIIERPGEAVDIRTITDLSVTYQGSYNYSETIIQGLSEHEYRDVEPHSEAPDFYLNPPRYSPLKSRTFPATLPCTPSANELAKIIHRQS